MKLVFLGTASCYPTPARGVSCTALQHDDGQVWLFDCGEGSQIQLQKSCIKPGKISKIFITHLHGDHLYGLPGLLCTLGNGLDPEASQKTTLEVYGPLGIRQFITTALGISRSPLVYKLSVIELVPRADQFAPDWETWPVQHTLDERFKLPQESAHRLVEYSGVGWQLLADDKWRVDAAALVHRIPSFGFVLKEAPCPGQLNVAKLQSEGVKPGPIYGKLKAGQTVEHEGKVLNPADYLGPELPGRELVILGDTANSQQILALTVSPDMLLHEATMEDKLEEKCIQFGHSTPRMAVEFALQSRAKHLVLFHLSPRYRPIQNEKGEEAVTAQILLDEANAAVAAAANTSNVSRTGNLLTVSVAEDFKELEVHRSK